MGITGTLKQAKWCAYPYGSICGVIYDDINNRFRDGTTIWTSTVQEDLGNGLYRTLNSVYKVEFIDETHRPTDLPME